MTSLLSPKKNYIEPLLIAEATRNLSSGTSIKCKKKKIIPNVRRISIFHKHQLLNSFWLSKLIFKLQ